MLSSLVSWILSTSSSSSSSSSSEEDEEEESLDINNNKSDYENFVNENVEDQKDHYIGACNVDDTIPIAHAISNASPVVTVVALPAVTDDTDTATAIVTRLKRQRNKYSAGVRQYQRLWTKQDEMELLKGYLNYIKQQGRKNTSLQSEVASFYDQVMPKFSVDFNRSQLVEKLHRLKRKHKVALDKGSKEVQVSFKSPDEQAIFEISQKIWGNDTDHDVLDVHESRPASECPDIIDNVKMKGEHVDSCEEIDTRLHKRVRLTTDDVTTKNDQDNGDTTSIKALKKP